MNAKERKSRVSNIEREIELLLRGRICVNIKDCKECELFNDKKGGCRLLSIAAVGARAL